MTTLRCLMLWAALSGAGCGLTLDYDPPSPDGDAHGTLDSSTLQIDAGIDGGARDVGAPRDARPGLDTGNVVVDAAPSDDAGIITTVDATPVLDAPGSMDAALDDGGSDATTSDASRVDAALIDASVTDAASTDGGSDAAMTIDASMRDAAMVTCMGVHPIVGPPRTCNPGSCLCVDIDACFTVDTVASCCTGTFVCAPPASDCMPAHPIVGPPRTCTSGSCYCSNPDACFPADRAGRCCPVSVTCVL